MLVVPFIWRTTLHFQTPHLMHGTKREYKARFTAEKVSLQDGHIRERDA